MASVLPGSGGVLSPQVGGRFSRGGLGEVFPGSRRLFSRQRLVNAALRGGGSPLFGDRFSRRRSRSFERFLERRRRMDRVSGTEQEARLRHSPLGPALIAIPDFSGVIETGQRAGERFLRAGVLPTTKGGPSDRGRNRLRSKRSREKETASALGGISAPSVDKATGDRTETLRTVATVATLGAIVWLAR